MKSKEVIGHPNYTIREDGKVIRKDGRVINPIYKKGGGGSTYYCIGIQGKKYGLATLVANHFVKKHEGCNKVIFKDRNNQNVNASNLVWVDNETFWFYCGTPTKPLLIYDKDFAISKCKDLNLLAYYRTGNEDYLQDCWAKIDQSLSESFYLWKQVKAGCYLYFIERVERFSIIGNPQGLIVLYAKGLRQKEESSISKFVKREVFLGIDESIR